MIRAALILALGACLCHADDKITVYNHIEGEETPLGKKVIAALSPKVSIIDLPASEDYVKPKVTGGSLPRVARTPEGKFLGGKVVVAYIVTLDGKAAETVILESSDERLNPFVKTAMESWRFTPATSKGVPLATMAAQDFTFPATPTEFVTQILEPTGGKIQRPKDWFYAESSSSSGYLWTISREDTANNQSYVTGMRIQMISKIKEGTGKTAEQFIRDFLASKKKEADKVIDECEPKEQYLFTRICLETEEGPFHIRYSLFWGSDDLDLAVVTIQGTRKELWDVYEPAFAKMGDFELIDMKRFEKKSP